MKKLLLTITVLFLIASSAFALQTGLIFNGDMQGEEGNSYLGFVARSNFGLGGLELAIMPKVSPEFDFSSYRFIVSPSIGWGSPELRIFAGIMPHIEINKGEFEFEPSLWGVGAGSTFAIAENVIGFFEFFAEFDVTGKTEVEGFAANTMLSVGITYNFDLGF